MTRVTALESELEHIANANQRGVDKPEIQDWKWTP